MAGKSRTGAPTRSGVLSGMHAKSSRSWIKQHEESNREGRIFPANPRVPFLQAGPRRINGMAQFIAPGLN
jgi:hypothetical protein